jgi:membrane protein required for colicin V production
MEQHSGLNIVDLVVFAVILLSGALALWRGFVRELLSLAAWTGAAYATVYFYPLLRPWMHQHIKNEFAGDAPTGLILFCVALALLIPLGYFISGLVRGRTLTAIDRSLGFVFGLARGVLVVSLLFLITLWVWPEKEPEVLAQARTRPYMAEGAEVMKSFLPEDDSKKTADGVKTPGEKPDVAPPLDQAPTPAATTTTVTAAKTDPAPQAKPGTSSSSKDEVRQVIDHLLSSPPANSGKP